MFWKLALPLLASAAAAVEQAASYDYIVVGSGPGGGPLAANLARAGYSTLLLEAGEDRGDDPAVLNIQNFNAVANDPSMRWDFFVKHSDDPARELKFEHTVWRRTDGSFYVGTNPPRSATHLGIWYPRTGTLGGCAMHNAAVAQVPPDDDWNIVANMTGDKTWLASNMRKYFMQIENNTYLPAGTPGHGFNGWVEISAGYGGPPSPNTDGWAIDAQIARVTGQNISNLPALTLRDLNDNSPTRDQDTGFYAMVGHINTTGQRTGPNHYIKATLNDPKKYPLTVQLHSLVTKILFSNSSTVPTAIGVEVMVGANMYGADPHHKNGTKGNITQIYAAKEVIISGGSFNSPQILKLSGIGPADELKKFNITVVKDLPGVGERLADNYEGSLLQLGSRDLKDMPGYVVNMMRTPTAPTKNRNIYAFCGSFSFEGFWPGYPTDYGASQYECAIVHMGPKSQAGSVKLRSADPQDVPDINFRFFEHNGDQDLQEILDAMKQLRSGLRAINATMMPWNELHPCPGTNQNCTDEAQKELIKTQAYSHHATSSCAIGADNDPMAVLDSKFRVRGVKNLRVVDASAFPVVPGAFPVIPTMILSQKASESILQDAKPM